jgi:hypothetical protein
VGQKDYSPWFCPICRAKALRGKEAYLLKAFLVTFVATKVTRLPAAMSGTMFVSSIGYYNNYELCSEEFIISNKLALTNTI